MVVFLLVLTVLVLGASNVPSVLLAPFPAQFTDPLLFWCETGYSSRSYPTQVGRGKTSCIFGPREKGIASLAPSR